MKIYAPLCVFSRDFKSRNHKQALGEWSHERTKNPDGSPWGSRWCSRSVVVRTYSTWTALFAVSSRSGILQSYLEFSDSWIDPDSRQPLTRTTEVSDLCFHISIHKGFWYLSIRSARKNTGGKSRTERIFYIGESCFVEIIILFSNTKVFDKLWSSSYWKYWFLCHVLSNKQQLLQPKPKAMCAITLRNKDLDPFLQNIHLTAFSLPIPTTTLNYCV